MITYYLRFDSEAEARQALIDALWMEESGELILPDNFRWDAIGSIVTTPAVLDAAGIEISAAVLDSRHHVNIYAIDGSACPAPLQPFLISAPSNPVRVFGVKS